MKWRIAILCIWLGCFSYLPAQMHSYEVYREGKLVGQMQVDRKQLKEGFEYRVRCDISVHFVVRIDLLFLFGSEYRQGQLMRAYTRNLRDGKIRNASELRWEDGCYIMKMDAESRRIQGVVRQSATQLYFEEPAHGDQIFSERHGTWMQVMAVGDHRYVLAHKNGHKDFYTYENGRCVHILVPHSLGDTEFRLQTAPLP